MKLRLPVCILLFGFSILNSAIAASAQQASSVASSTSDAALFKVRSEFNVMIPMRDGVRLAADIQRPDAEGGFPVILARTPYGKFSKAAFEQAEYFAQRGYVYVNQDVRGRYDSEGKFQVLVNEGRDGYDTIEFLARQPFSNGKVGTFGGSYLAWDQWLAAELQPPHLRAMVVQSTPPDIFLTAWWRGAFLMNELFWCLLLDGRVNQELSVYSDPKVVFDLPVSTMDQAFGRRLYKTFRAWVAHDTFSDFWKEQAYQSKISRVTVPVLHVDGWYDLRDVSATLQNYNTMVRESESPEARRNQRVIIGPWAHGNYDHRKLGDLDFGANAVIDRKVLYLKWYDCHLLNKNCDQVLNQAPVRIFVMGDNRWRDEQEWPPQRARSTPYFFHSSGKANSSSGDGELTKTAPQSEPTDHYTYDPRNPTTVEISADDTLTADQRKPESGNDMLVFTSAVLNKPLEVSGRIEVKLWAASSAPDTDWVARLVDVHPDGFAQRLTDGIVRASYHGKTEYPQSRDDFSSIAPGTLREYTLDLYDISNVFLKGHRIRVEIASAFFPLFTRNLNTGKNSLATAEMQQAHQTIYHDAGHPSRILLPLVETDDGGSSLSGNSDVIAIPQGKSVDLDGRIAQNEWDDAATTEIIVSPDWKSQVRMKHDGEFLYFLFEGVKHRAERLFPEILIDPQNRKGDQWEKGEWWFHVSFNLCEGNGEPNIYKKDGVFQCSHQKEGWVATNPPVADVIEVKVSFAKLGIKPAAGLRLGLALGLTNATGDLTQKWFFSTQTANINRPASWGTAILK